MMVLSKGIDRVNLDTRPELPASAVQCGVRLGKDMRCGLWLLKEGEKTEAAENSPLEMDPGSAKSRARLQWF